MSFLLKDGENSIRLDTLSIGMEVVFFNGMKVSEKKCVWGATHTWDIGQAGIVHDYKLVVSITGFRNSLILYRDGAEVGSLSGNLHDMQRRNKLPHLDGEGRFAQMWRGFEFMGVAALIAFVAYAKPEGASGPLIGHGMAVSLVCVCMALGGALFAGRPYWHGILLGILSGVVAMGFLEWSTHSGADANMKMIMVLYLVGCTPGYAVWFLLDRCMGRKFGGTESR